jgi:DME family drug/metabolite transporter
MASDGRGCHRTCREFPDLARDVGRSRLVKVVAGPRSPDTQALFAPGRAATLAIHKRVRLWRDRDLDGDERSAGNRRDTWLGLTLVLSAAVAWSTMGLFVRMAPGVDVWTVVFWRSIFGGLSIVALAMIERRRWSFNWRGTLTPAGVAITALIASGVFASIYSMQNTTIANGCVINATAPFMAAVLAWLWFRERPGLRTIVCTVIAGAGVIVTVSGTIAAGGGHLKGDLAMVYSTFALTMMTVITRRYRDTPMLESVALACLMAAAIAWLVGDPFTIPTGQMALLGIFGIVTQGGGLGVYTMGARRLPAAQASLLTSAEMPMAPLWVWIFFDEVPAVETFIGGALVLAAILLNIGLELRSRPKIGSAEALATATAVSNEGV